MAESLLSTSSDEDNIVWSKGDVCLAKFSEDELYYKAKIIGFLGSGYRQKVQVTFCGYGSDNNEDVPIKAIKRVKKKRLVKKKTHKDSLDVIAETRMFSPLQGHEETHRLEQKFALLDEEEGVESVGGPASSNQKLRWKTTKRRLLSDSTGKDSCNSQPKRKKAIVAIGGNVKSPRSNQSSPMTISTSVRKRTKAMTETISEFSSDDEATAKSKTSPVKGFSDEDLEKPYFPNPSHLGHQEACVLSSGDDEKHEIPATINR